MKYIVTCMQSNDGAVVQVAAAAEDEVKAAIWINECIESDKDAEDCGCIIKNCENQIEKVSSDMINNYAEVMVFFDNGNRYKYQVLPYSEA